MKRLVLVAAFVVTFLLVVTECQSAGADYYKILGVPRGASIREIKKAYRELSRTYHPDKNPEHKDKYLEFTKAYDVLSDEEKKKIYDLHGEEGLKRGAGGHAHDPFGGLFNFGFGQQQQGVQKSAETVIPLEVTLDDLYNGRTIRFLHEKQGHCQKCGGSGAKDPNDVRTCGGCSGTGMKVKVIQQPGFMQQFQTVCDECGGKGKIVKSQCPHCRGAKVAMHSTKHILMIEQGMADGADIRLDGEGSTNPDMLPGDLVFKIVTLPHKKFARNGADLEYFMTISLLDALVGFRAEITHLDGHKVPVARDEITPPGFVLTIPGEGMPHHNTPSVKGTLYVKFTVKFPTTLTKDQQDQLRTILGKK